MVERVEEGIGKGVDKEDGKGEEEEGFDEGKARMKLALVFAVIGFACLTGAPFGGAILGIYSVFLLPFSFPPSSSLPSPPLSPFPIFSQNEADMDNNTAEGNGSWVGAQVFAGSTVAVGGCLLVGARFAREGWGSGRV